MALSINTRREFICVAAATGAGVILCGCRGESTPADQSAKNARSKPEEGVMGGEVTATEDLMREHGVLRRALLVYSEAAAKLRANASGVAPGGLHKTAELFRAFGEEYHERKLEETYIFPAVRKAGGAAGDYPDILIAQHARGRELTDYILGVTQAAKLGVTTAEQLAGALDSLVRMYRAHASREDTIVFPAWKQTLTVEQLDEMNDKFEEIEHEQFGEDGFEDAVRQISDIENELAMADLAQYTAQSPPAP